jgi:hypothetical protein
VRLMRAKRSDAKRNAPVDCRQAPSCLRQKLVCLEQPNLKQFLDYPFLFWHVSAARIASGRSIDIELEFA